MARTAEAFANEALAMKGLFQEFTKMDDFDLAASINDGLNEIYKTCSLRDIDARKLIRELSEQVQGLSCEAAYPHREGLHSERVSALQREIVLANGLVSELNQSTRSAEEQLEQVEEQLRSLEAAEAAEAAAHEVEFARMRVQLSLYQALTYTAFPKSQPNTLEVKISDQKTCNIRHVTFDLANRSKYDITNELWNLL